MLNKVMILIGSAMLCLFLSSCYTLQSKYIVGEIIENKKIDVENRWQYEDKDFFTRVIDSETLIGSRPSLIASARNMDLSAVSYMEPECCKIA